MAAIIAFLTSSATLAKIALGAINFANSILEHVDKAELEDKAYNKAVDDATIAMYKRLGRVDVVISQGAQMTPDEKRKVLKDD